MWPVFIVTTWGGHLNGGRLIIGVVAMSFANWASNPFGSWILLTPHGRIPALHYLTTLKCLKSLVWIYIMGLDLLWPQERFPAWLLDSNHGAWAVVIRCVGLSGRRNRTGAVSDQWWIRHAVGLANQDGDWVCEIGGQRILKKQIPVPRKILRKWGPRLDLYIIRVIYKVLPKTGIMGQNSLFTFSSNVHIAWREQPYPWVRKSHRYVLPVHITLNTCWTKGK